MGTYSRDEVGGMTDFLITAHYLAEMDEKREERIDAALERCGVRIATFALDDGEFQVGSQTSIGSPTKAARLSLTFTSPRTWPPTRSSRSCAHDLQAKYRRRRGVRDEAGTSD
jgi:hypothetical protein